jgi:hypothetical protein
MSARLTLLILCDQTEPESIFISAFVSAEFQVLVARHIEYAKVLLSNLAVDAIMILQKDNRNDGLTGSALKLLAPETPVILCRNGMVRQGAYPGVDSVLRADFQDEVVARGVAIFFRQSLTASRSGRVTEMPGKNLRLLQPERDSRLAV